MIKEIEEETLEQILVLIPLEEKIKKKIDSEYYNLLNYENIKSLIIQNRSK